MGVSVLGKFNLYAWILNTNLYITYAHNTNRVQCSCVFCSETCRQYRSVKSDGYVQQNNNIICAQVMVAAGADRRSQTLRSRRRRRPTADVNGNFRTNCLNTNNWFKTQQEPRVDIRKIGQVLIIDEKKIIQFSKFRKNSSNTNNKSIYWYWVIIVL